MSNMLYDDTTINKNFINCLTSLLTHIEIKNLIVYNIAFKLNFALYLSSDISDYLSYVCTLDVLKQNDIEEVGNIAICETTSEISHAAYINGLYTYVNKASIDVELGSSCKCYP